ncbi:MAG: hypothetical protein AMXMBFR20_24680 [Planctomycetia bacterium]
MPISVGCKCGKQLKVKDELAGKAVRCPACKSALRIPGEPAAAVGEAGKSSTPAVDAKAALLKFEAAKKKKHLSAEEEAAYREEHNKLIASYDQLSGKGATKDGKPAPRPTQVLPKKPTIFTKIADAFGVVFGTFTAKWLVIFLLLGGGAVGSGFLVKYVTSYVSDESGAKMSNEERSKLLLSQVADDIKAKKWDDARDKLDQIIRLNKRLELRRDYRDFRKQVSEALEAEKK